MRVLYVDDDRVNSLLFTETCRLAGDVAVETAFSGQEALELAPRWLPDLLVVDLHLPDTNGYELLARLRHCLGAPSLPAILCTADEASLVRAPASAAGFDAVWSKPVELQLIIDELQRRKHSSPPEGP